MRSSRGTPMALAALVTAILVVLLAGCAAPWPFPQPTPDLRLPDSQQILRPLAAGVELPDLDLLDPTRISLDLLDPVLFALPSEQNLAQLLFPGLLTLDEQSRPVDWAAERHEVSADGLTYTFHLRKGMTWSDGTPIDAATFAYSINRALDPCTGAVTTYLEVIKGAQSFFGCPHGVYKGQVTLIGSSLLTPDPLTLQIVLERPAGYFLAALTTSLALAVPQQFIEKFPGNGYPRAWTRHLADSGGFGGNLYKLVKVTGAERDAEASTLVFERNERFWGQKPYLRRIEYTVQGSRDDTWANFTAGQGDLSQPPLKYLGDSNRLKDTVIQQTPLLYISWLQPNWRIAPFDDVRVRQAFSLAIDRQALAHQALADTVIPSYHLVPAGMSGYAATLKDPAGRGGKDALIPDRDVARALATAYAADKCAGDFTKCPPINLRAPIGDSLQDSLPLELQRREAQLILDDWRQIAPGWPIEAVPLGCDLQFCDAHRYQFYTASWSYDYPDPQYFVSSLWTTQAQYNFSFVSILAVDALSAQADALGDQEGRVQLYQQAEQLLVTQGAAIPLYQYTSTYVVRSRVVGWRLAPSGVTPLSVWQQVYIKR